MLQQQKHTVKIAAGMLPMPTAKTYCELLLVLCAAYKGRDFALVIPYFKIDCDYDHSII